jgi:hypothetical protein
MPRPFPLLTTAQFFQSFTGCDVEITYPAAILTFRSFHAASSIKKKKNKDENNERSRTQCILTECLMLFVYVTVHYTLKLRES